eukprot:s72_g25.t6
MKRQNGPIPKQHSSGLKREDFRQLKCVCRKDVLLILTMLKTLSSNQTHQLNFTSTRASHLLSGRAAAGGFNMAPTNRAQMKLRHLNWAIGCNKERAVQIGELPFHPEWCCILAAPCRAILLK